MIPEDKEFYAPFDGKVSLISKDTNTIGIISISGVELLVSIKNEVKLGIPYFTSTVNQGMEIKGGEKIFDIDNSLLNNHDNVLEISITFTNSSKYFKVLTSRAANVIACEDNLFLIFEKLHLNKHYNQE